MLLKDPHINSSLNRALTNLAKSYDYHSGNWRRSSYELNLVANILKHGEWNFSIKKDITRSIQRRINKRYPTTAIRDASGHCTQHIAENAMRRIMYQMRHDITHAERNFFNITNHI